MTYQALARKWRPRRFEDVVGQEHVLRALSHALADGRLHHAYLFSGTRGIGKTTVARILAKCLNCEQGVVATPCGQCDACRELDEGRFVDLIEVDAASRTKVEDTRELLDNVQYAPTRGRYKVYLIDEVHMLSGHSFNALLKTLEEPPEHVKFLLATTDPQKLPVTVLSRCLQFHLRRLPVPLIRERLLAIGAEEEVVVEPGAASRLARAADGSLRDALSLLDQALAYGDRAARDDEVAAMLGAIERRHVLDLLAALAADDGDRLVAAARDLADRAGDFDDALAELIATVHTLALAQQVPTVIDDDEPEREQLLALAERLAAEDLQLYYQIGINARRDLPYAPDPATGFEMALLRMLAFRPAGTPPRPGRSAPSSAGGGAAGDPSAAEGTPGNSAAPVPERAVQGLPLRGRRESVPGGSRPPSMAADAPEGEALDSTLRNGGGTPLPLPDGGVAPEAAGALPAVGTAATGGSIAEPAVDGDAAEAQAAERWREIVRGLDGTLYALAAHCEWGARRGGRVILRLDQAHDYLLSEERRERLQEALTATLGEQIELRIERVAAAAATPAQAQAEQARQRQRDAEQALTSDAGLQALSEAFDARLYAIRPAAGDTPH